MQRIRLVVDFAADIGGTAHDLHAHDIRPGDLIDCDLIDNDDGGCVASGG